MEYTKIQLWKTRGFINDSMNYETQINLAKNLSFGRDLLLCNKVLKNDIDFYDEVETMLLPIIVYYTLNTKIDITYIIHKFIDFCDNNLRIKYNINKSNDDYLLCQEFINNIN